VFAEAAMLVVVFSAGGLMEDYVADKARSSIRALMSLAPPAAALLLADGATIPVPVQDLGRGQLVRGRVIPSVQTLRLWALRTGVSYDWLAGDAHRSARARRAAPGSLDHSQPRPVHPRTHSSRLRRQSGA